MATTDFRSRAAELAGLVDETPALVIDRRVARANVERAAQTAQKAGVSLRPHVKTHKMVGLAQLQIASGSEGIQVAKLGEAEAMVDGGVSDVLVGYPIVGKAKLDRLTSLAERARISVSLDSLEVAQAISAVARMRGVLIGVLVEIDTGQGRLGVAPGDAATELAASISTLPGLELVGVLTHEGHAVLHARSSDELRRMTEVACQVMAETATRIRDRGLRADVVSVGASPTFRFAVACPGVTEVRPGSYIFNDRTQLAHGSASEDDLAAFVVATVVSRPVSDRVVVDAGTKALSSDQVIHVSALERSYGAVAGKGWVVERASEEHGVIRVDTSARVHIGQRVVIVPNHVCPVVNLFNAASIVEDGRVVAQWPIDARGRVW